VELCKCLLTSYVLQCRYPKHNELIPSRDYGEIDNNEHHLSDLPMCPESWSRITAL